MHHSAVASNSRASGTGRAPAAGRPVARTAIRAGDSHAAHCNCGGTCPRCRAAIASAQAAEEGLNSSAEALAPAPRAFMEQRFGRDFSQVRVHHGPQADASARALGAHAYTVGSDIVFGAGRYAPHSADGRYLLAHELTHTLQQAGDPATARVAAPTVQRLANGTSGGTEFFPSDPAAEAEADAFAGQAVAEQPGAEPPGQEAGADSALELGDKPDCKTVCKALDSMRRSAGRICEIDGSEGEKCQEARKRVTAAEAKAAPCNCPPLKEAPPKTPSPAPICATIPTACACFDLKAARDFSHTKLSQSSALGAKWAAGINRGNWSHLFPRNIKAELEGGAKAVAGKLKGGTMKIACAKSVPPGEVGNYVAQDDVLLAMTTTNPTWSQTLLERVVLHECLHAVCSHLPSQVGRDPYDGAARQGFNPSIAMHEDLKSVMKPYPDDTPLW